MTLTVKLSRKKFAVCKKSMKTTKVFSRVRFITYGISSSVKQLKQTKDQCYKYLLNSHDVFIKPLHVINSIIWYQLYTIIFRCQNNERSLYATASSSLTGPVIIIRPLYYSK